ncbi:MAG: bifunctional phosphoribosylaminoimidazolecarboxamide formyltransferase/IMP cyclohydrolase [Candidatus Edwardsbacteria bacterium]|jgi:phosphoribosylaminoimidazolecarboxamide formyltransferase/IMP cyclohydrolase|nr:bifunctional phosphoribosylaminoimidazolecarboxamide formyltransferase/IMP cyclohydrolase [Candidatus Edwardsbacteria bacterium]
MPTKRAIISVHDKTGVVEFAKGLANLGFEIVSSGGTAMHLREQGVAVTDVADVTGFPEMLDGRVKTLHPKVHAGILARRDKPEHMAKIAEHGIAPVDVVCVNLYPFEATVAKAGVTEDEAIEQIDIGGPSLVRAAAKNFSAVAVVTDPSQYGTVLAEIKRDGTVSAATTRTLFRAAFALTARYDAAIAAHFGADRSAGAADVPESLDLRLAKVLPLRYGENPHQPAGFYLRRGSGLPFEQLHGKEISYNNILDLSAAWELAAEYDRPCCAIVKHTNPCGLGCAEDLHAAYLLARDGELPPAPISRFGGIIAVNRPLDRATAEEIAAPGGFYEVIAAPAFEDGVKEIFAGRKGWGQNVRLVRILGRHDERLNVRSAIGGLLVQAGDGSVADWDALQYATALRPTAQQLRDLEFAFAAVKHVKSNAIVIAKDSQLVGLGAGQPNRVASVRLAAAQAGERSRGAALASDGYFPFPDNVDEAAAAGIAAIVQPGGSVKDAEVVAAAERAGIAMVLTGVRHFRH